MTRRIFTALAILTACGAADAQTAGDPLGFVPLLNRARAARGLAPVVPDAGAAAVARANNARQAAGGLGHFVLGGYGQCAAVGVGDAAQALAMWANSPAHAAILFSPTLAAVGFDLAGGCATASTAAGASMAPAAAIPVPWTWQPSPWTWRPAPARRGRWRR